MWLPLERPARQPARSNPEPAALASRFVEPLRGEEPPTLARLVPLKPAPVTGRPGPASTQPNRPAEPAKPKAQAKPGRSINALFSALVVAALVPSAILVAQLSRDMMRPPSVTLPVATLSMAKSPPPPELAYLKKDTSRLEAGADDGEETLPPAVAVTDHVPGVAAWGLSPIETGALPLWATGQTGSPEISRDDAAGDGPALAGAGTPLSEAAPATMDVAEAAGSQPPDEIAQAERPKPGPGAVPLPQRKPGAAAGTEPLVRTVKVVTIPAPNPARPHDGAYALGSPADEPQAAAEWMQTKTAVDMHAKAEQSSETVKVAEGGVKLRVMARDKRWIQVSDPATSTTGWIYDRFLTPAAPPAQ
jgi:hypothetical protein